VVRVERSCRGERSASSSIHRLLSPPHPSGRLPALVSLDVAGGGAGAGPAASLADAAAAGCPWLRHLNLSSLRTAVGPEDAAWPAKLRSLTLRLAMAGPARAALAALALDSTACCLCSLDLSGSPGAADDSLERAVRAGAFVRLRRLKLRGCREVSDAGLSNVLLARDESTGRFLAPRLRSLDVRECERLGDAVASALAVREKDARARRKDDEDTAQLEHLDFAHCWRLTDGCPPSASEDASSLPPTGFAALGASKPVPQPPLTLLPPSRPAPPQPMPVAPSLPPPSFPRSVPRRPWRG